MASKLRHTSPDLSVIIVNYNVRDFLNHALVSIQKALKKVRAEVVVVDNGSDDGSVEMVRGRFPAVQLIVNEANVGFARANNLALKQAHGRFLLLINPDTVVQENTFQVMVKYFEDHPSVGLAGCKILNPDGTFQLACRRSFPTPWVAFTKIVGLSRVFPHSRWFGQYNLTYKNTDETYKVDAVSGSFMMLRREVLDTVGGLDEDFFMYGEDLDWCYRIQKAGWKIAYVHTTQIIHYKGESTKRSSIDEIKTFYEAMSLFVEKHFKYPAVVVAMLKVAIAVTSFFALLVSVVKPLSVGLVDFLFVNLSLLIAEYIRRGDVFLYPTYAYPIVFVVPAIVVIGHLYAAGVYTYRKMSVSRSLVAVAISYIIISALIAFFKEYAFSRIIVVISGLLSAVFIPGWRTVVRLSGATRAEGRSSLFGKRTLIVGTHAGAQQLLRKLRSRVGDGYEVVGFVDTTRERIGRELNGLPILGSIDNVGKVIREQKVSDVIFSPRALSYAQILSVIGKSGSQMVNFHLVPSTMEVIIGKASVDNLDDLPLVQIAYNIEKPFHRLSKRMFDVAISGLLLITVYPILSLKKILRGQGSGFVLSLPSVFAGKASLVGPMHGSSFQALHNGQPGYSLYLGKPGLTGLVQLHGNQRLSLEEVEQYNLYYARNQSVLLDTEILLKTLMKRRSGVR